MKPISDFPEYSITTKGDVISHKFGRITKLKPVKCTHTGYLLVTLVKAGNIRKNKRIHRLLMEAYVPNPKNKAHVNHIDGNKLNNNLVNLEWATSKENSQHSVNTGLSEPAYKVTRKSILMYSKDKTTLLNEFISIHEAARITGIAYQNISKVVRELRHTAGGYHWKYKNV